MASYPAILGADSLIYTDVPGKSGSAPAHTRGVRLASTTACRVRFEAEGGEAVETDLLIVPNSHEYFRATPGMQVHVVRDTLDGVLSVAWVM